MTRCPVTNRIRGRLTLFQPIPPRFSLYEMVVMARASAELRSLPDQAPKGWQFAGD